MSNHICDCGQHYSSIGGLEACQAGNHGKGWPNTTPPSAAGEDESALAKRMKLRVALSFADAPRRHDTLQAPADTMDELYEALSVLAAAYRTAVNSHAALEGALSTANERIAELEGQRRLWLDTDNNAKVMLRQEHEIEDLTSQLAAVEAERDRALEATGKCIAILDDLEDSRPADPGCIQCTAGVTPNNFNTGLCGYHLAKSALLPTPQGERK